MDKIDFLNKKVLVYGWAKSGRAVYNLLKKWGAKADAYVDNKPDNATGINFIKTENNFNFVKNYDFIVKNPGISYEKPILKMAVNQKIPILTEPQVALSAFHGKIVAVTGSNGKTTTTTLIGKILKKAGFDCEVGGNIGIPVSEIMQRVHIPQILVLELSSFQLLGMPDVKPTVSVITNLFSPHLNFHHTRKNYLKAVFSITKNQNRNNCLVLNGKSKDCLNFGKFSNAKKYYFAEKSQSNISTYIENGKVYFNKKIVINISDIAPIARHNIENILAVITSVKIFNVDNICIKKILSTFRGLEHRLEFVGKIKGRIIYNDSKATDIEATQSALKSFKQKITLIAGGLDRGNNFGPLTPYLKNVINMIVYGQTKYKLKEMAKKVPNIKKLLVVNNLKEAVIKAKKFSIPGQIILFSPAAASWDQFPNFEIRGTAFKKMINNEGKWK